MRQSNVNVDQMRPSVSVMKAEKERDMYRTSMFQQKEKRYSSASQGDLEAGPSDSTEVLK